MKFVMPNRSEPPNAGYGDDRWARLDAVLSKFEELWQKSRSVDFGGLLPPEADPLYHWILVRLFDLG